MQLPLDGIIRTCSREQSSVTFRLSFCLNRLVSLNFITKFPLFSSHCQPEEQPASTFQRKGGCVSVFYEGQRTQGPGRGGLTKGHSMNQSDFQSRAYVMVPVLYKSNLVNGRGFQGPQRFCAEGRGIWGLTEVVMGTCSRLNPSAQDSEQRCSVFAEWINRSLSGKQSRKWSEIYRTNTRGPEEDK